MGKRAAAENADRNVRPFERLEDHLGANPSGIAKRDGERLHTTEYKRACPPPAARYSVSSSFLKRYLMQCF
jgi:hypothetical protein